MKDKPQIGRKICSYISDKGLISVIDNFLQLNSKNQLIQLKHKQKIFYYLERLS